MTRPLRSAFCMYCKRSLTPARAEMGTSFTFDHVRAQSDGGWKRVPCCRKCNHLKSNLPADDWFAFIRAHPRWWKLFDTPAQVARAAMQMRTLAATALKASYDGVRI